MLENVKCGQNKLAVKCGQNKLAVLSTSPVRHSASLPYSGGLIRF